MTALEHVVRAFARRTTQNGDVVIITNGHPALVDAFKELGWSDPYPDPLLLPPKREAPKVVVTDLTSGQSYVADFVVKPAPMPVLDVKPKGAK